MGEAISFIVPGVPMSANMYVRHTRSGRHYVRKEALKFKQDLCALVPRGQGITAKQYEVHARFFLGKGQKGDLDNFAKLIGDGLRDAGVFKSDAAIVRWVLEKDRDPFNPRTEITVTGVLG